MFPLPLCFFDEKAVSAHGDLTLPQLQQAMEDLEASLRFCKTPQKCQHEWLLKTPQAYQREMAARLRIRAIMTEYLRKKHCSRRRFEVLIKKWMLLDRMLMRARVARRGTNFVVSLAQELGLKTKHVGLQRVHLVPFEYLPKQVGKRKVTLEAGYVLCPDTLLPDAVCNMTAWPLDSFDYLEHTEEKGADPLWEVTTSSSSLQIAYDTDEEEAYLERRQRKRRAVRADATRDLHFRRPLRLFLELLNGGPLHFKGQDDPGSAKDLPADLILPPCIAKIHRELPHLRYEQRDAYGWYASAAGVSVAYRERLWMPAWQKQYNRAGEWKSILSMWKGQANRMRINCDKAKVGPSCLDMQNQGLCPFAPATLNPKTGAVMKKPSLSDCEDALTLCCDSWKAGERVTRRLLNVGRALKEEQ